MHSKVVPTPSPGQAQNTTSPTTALVVENRTSNPINLLVSEPRAVDAALRGGHYVRYVSDSRPGPDAGIWRTVGGVRERVSPFAIVRIDPGRGSSVEIAAIRPKTGDQRIYGGNLDDVASDLNRAAARIGFRGDRKLLYWALREFSDQARRQAAARGVGV